MAPAYEKQPADGVVLMFCRHCLRYSMGWCPVHQKGLKIDGLGRKRGTVHAPWRIGFFMPHFLFFILFLFSSCHYSRPNLEDESLSQQMRDSLTYLYERHYTWDINLEVKTDSVQLELLPVKGAYYQLHRGDRVVVAEFAVHPADSIDSVWVKLAHSQEVQGWLRETDLKRATDSISQAIYVFSDTHASYFIVVFAIFVAVWLVRVFRRKQLQLVYFNDIDSLYPLALCLLMAFCATVYESIQIFAPDTWEHYYYNPTLSPFKVPFVLSMFLVGLWLFLVVLLAVLDDLCPSCFRCFWWGYGCFWLYCWPCSTTFSASFRPRQRCSTCWDWLRRVSSVISSLF